MIKKKNPKLNITQYINGKKVEKEDLKKYTIENDTISRAIKEVNERINNPDKPPY